MVLDAFLGRDELGAIRHRSRSILERAGGKELEQWPSSSGDSGEIGRASRRGRAQDRVKSAVVAGSRNNIQKVVLNTRPIHRLGRPSSYNELLFADQSLLDYLLNVVSSVTIRGWLVYATFNEVIPAENLFRPQLERVE